MICSSKQNRSLMIAVFFADKNALSMSAFAYGLAIISPAHPNISQHRALPYSLYLLR